MTRPTVGPSRDVDQWLRARSRAQAYGKPVLAKVGESWLLVAGDLLDATRVSAMFKAYINRVNGIDTKRQLDKCFDDISVIVMSLSAAGHVEEVRKVLAQYRAQKVVDLPREWYPALLYDLKALNRELQPCKLKT